LNQVESPLSKSKFVTGSQNALFLGGFPEKSLPVNLLLWRRRRFSGWPVGGRMKNERVERCLVGVQIFMASA
jgi:hypothetical protein